MDLYLEREIALEKILELKGKDLREQAKFHGVTVFKDEKKNKGWAGHVIEKHLGLPLNSSSDPDFGDWELKVVPLKYLKTGRLAVKETMAVTMINPEDVREKDFKNSHLKTKLNKVVIVARIWENVEESRSLLHNAYMFDLTNKEIYNQIEEDYEIVRHAIITKGFGSLTGKMGKIVQPRTKGAGHGSTSRAFYVRTSFLKNILL
ncbi:MvaI/BcnI family restriction endonuclease [Neobacillus drentensis]|uniref:MvaI/BcnI family restriction endonuclease n=1 Tax=Neobacillus drentensis TaxID=220684 RepID=UPI0030038F7B